MAKPFYSKISVEKIEKMVDQQKMGSHDRKIIEGNSNRDSFFTFML